MFTSIHNPSKNLSRALELFWQALRDGWLLRLRHVFSQRQTRLRDFETERHNLEIQNSYSMRVQTVEIERIQGTLGKPEAFDAHFHPLLETSRSRWIGIAQERMQGHELPPVDLVEMDGRFYVRDGHHRISVAHSLGQQYIDAVITCLNVGSSRIL